MFWPFGKLNHAPSPYQLRVGVAWGLTMGAFRVSLPIEAYALALSKYFVSAILLRCSACTVNDIFDRHLDVGVGRFLFSVPGINSKIFRTLPYQAFAKWPDFRFRCFGLSSRSICH